MQRPDKNSSREKNERTSLFRWELVSLVAAVFILAAPFLYIVTHDDASLPIAEEAVFVGSEKCKNCHKAAYEKWFAV